jgi:hypothetical protein
LIVGSFGFKLPLSPLFLFLLFGEFSLALFKRVIGFGHLKILLLIPGMKQTDYGISRPSARFFLARHAFVTLLT